MRNEKACITETQSRLSEMDQKHTPISTFGHMQHVVQFPQGALHLFLKPFVFVIFWSLVQWIV